MTARGKTPDFALAVEVEEAFFHCSKCIIRSSLWTPEAWPTLDGLPSLAQTMVDAAALPMPVEALEEIIKQTRQNVCIRSVAVNRNLRNVMNENRFSQAVRISPHKRRYLPIFLSPEKSVYRKRAHLSASSSTSVTTRGNLRRRNRIMKG